MNALCKEPMKYKLPPKFVIHFDKCISFLTTFNFCNIIYILNT